MPMRPRPFLDSAARRLRPDAARAVAILVFATCVVGVPRDGGVTPVAAAASAGSPVPSAPTGLAVMTDSFGLIQMAWDASPAVPPLTGYLLEAGSAPGRTDVGSLTRPAAEPSFVATDVPPGTYYLRLRALTADAVSSPSNEVRLTVRPTANDAGAPAIPAWTQFRMLGSTAMLSWRIQLGSAPITASIVEAGTWPGMNDLGEVVTREMSLTVRDVPPGVYYVNLYAKNDRGTRRLTVPMGVIVTPSCTYVIGSNMIADLGRVGGFGQFGITTSDASCPWVAETDRTWFAMTRIGQPENPVIGTGTGGFTLQAPPNFGSRRVGLIKIRAAGREIVAFIQQRNFFEY